MPRDVHLNVNLQLHPDAYQRLTGWNGVLPINNTAAQTGTATGNGAQTQRGQKQHEAERQTTSARARAQQTPQHGKSEYTHMHTNEHVCTRSHASYAWHAC